MISDSCWVLVRDGLVWHLLAQGCRDPRGLYGRPTTCDSVTPLHPLDVLMFSQAQPRPLWRLCTDCLGSVETSPHQLFDLANCKPVVAVALARVDHATQIADEERAAVVDHAFRYDRRRG